MPKGLVRTAVLVAAALFGAALVVAPGCFIVLHSERDRFAAAERAHTQLLLAEAKVALEASLTARLASLRALAAFAASRPEAAQPEFIVFAKGLAASLPDIRSVQLARDFVVSHLYPASRNSGILGLDLLARLPEAQRAAVERAIATDTAVLDGPMPLLQGDLGLIIRQPVLVPREPGQPDGRWGLATIILDADAFFALSTTPDSGIRLAIRSLGDTGQPGRLLFGHGAVFENAPALMIMETPDGIWQLAATPALGWTAMPVPPTLLGGGFAAWLAPSAAVFVLLAWPTRLKAAVAAATTALDETRKGLERTVTERTSALLAVNDALRHSEARYRAFIDAASGMAFLKDDQLRYLVFNRNLCRFYGRPPEEILGRDVADILPPDLAEACRQSDRAALAGGTVVTTMESMGDRHFEVRKFPVPLGDGRTGVGAYVYDVTDRFAAETALRQSEEALRALYDHAPVGIFTSSPQGHYLKANAFLARMYGFDSPQELLATVANIQDQIYADSSDRQRLLELLTAQGALSNLEMQRRTRSGDLIWVLLNILAVRDASGRIIRLEGFCTDITERKRAQASLARQERELRIIFENSPLGLAAFGPDGAIVKYNARFRSLLGISPDDPAGSDFLARLPDVFGEALDRALTGRPAKAEGSHVPAPGERALILRAVFNPVADGGWPTPVIAAVEDVTARREGEQSLRLLRAAVEQSPASIVVTNAKGRIQYVNPYFTELTGYSAEEAQGKTPRILNSGHHDKDFFKAMWQTLLAGNIWRGELCNRKRNGDLYWEDSSISPIRDDQGLITHFVAIKEDITAQKEREARLHRLMREFEAIFNASSVGIVHLGADGRVVRANRHFGALFGIDPESLAGRSLEAIHETEHRRAALRREILEAVGGGREASVEQRFRTRSGQMLWCSVNGRRIDPGSPEAGSLWIFDDITARKDLEAIREDVERIMRHDLKTPLNSILNLPELVAALGETNQEQRDVLGEIEQSGRVMLEQIELSLDLYKMETGAYVPDVQRIDLARILASAADMLAPLAKARGLTLALPADQPPVFVQGNALLVQTIAGNLLKNALEAESAGRTVAVRFLSDNGQAGFAVSNPTPVPAEIVPIFFEKYVTSGKRGGSGLGTYSARLMTECQGGEIRLDVAPDAGTTVSVRLPAE